MRATFPSQARNELGQDQKQPKKGRRHFLLLGPSQKHAREPIPISSWPAYLQDKSAYIPYNAPLITSHQTTNPYLNIQTRCSWDICKYSSG